MENKNQETEAMNTKMTKYKPKLPPQTVTAIQFYHEHLHEVWPIFHNTRVVSVYWREDHRSLSFNINNTWLSIIEGSWLVKDDIGRLTIMTDEEFRLHYSV